MLCPCKWTACIMNVHCCPAFRKLFFFFFMNTYNQHLVSFPHFVIVLINCLQDFVLSNSVFNHTSNEQIRLQLHCCLILLISHLITNQIGLHTVQLPLLNGLHSVQVPL